MPKTLRYALLVFAGGCCYGVMIPLVRTAYAQGFTSMDVMAVQYLFGIIFLGVLVVSISRRKMSLKQALQLLGLGIVAAGVSFGYYHALGRLPAATAVVLLFQFVWMGVVLQSIIERKLPNRITVISVIIIMVGTLLAEGILEQGAVTLDPLGIFFGLLSAIFYTAFLFLSGRVATELPALNRTFFTTVGSFLITLSVVPSFFTNGSLAQGLWIVGIPLSLLGIVAPILLIQTGAPHLHSSVTTIMASSELPSGIIMAALFIGEKITLPIAVGVAIILAGIVLSQFDDLRKLLSRKQS